VNRHAITRLPSELSIYHVFSVTYEYACRQEYQQFRYEAALNTHRRLVSPMGHEQLHIGIMVFWDVATCNMAQMCTNVSEQPAASIFRADYQNEGRIFLWRRVIWHRCVPTYQRSLLPPCLEPRLKKMYECRLNSPQSWYHLTKCS
jgi:hypothetical protein